MKKVTHNVQTKEEALALVAALKADFEKVSLNLQESYWKRAEIIYKLKVSVAWGVTDYQTFNNYREAELDISESKACIYARYIKDLNRLGYTKAELKTLSAAFSCGPLGRIFASLKKKVGVPYLIKKYKNVKSENLRSVSNGALKTGQTRINLILGEDYMVLFNTLMKEYGMVLTVEGRRVGVESAVKNFLDDWSGKQLRKAA